MTSKIQEKRKRVPVTITAQDNGQFDKKIQEICEAHTVIEKYINLSAVPGQMPGSSQPVLVTMHHCYMVCLMTDQEIQNYNARQKLQV